MLKKESRQLILTQRRRETKKEDDAHPLSQFPSLMEGLGVAPPFFLVPLPYGGVRGGFPSLMEGQGVGSLLANAAGDSQAGGDGGQDGCYCLNDEFPSFLLHGSFFLRLVHFCLWNVE